MSEVTRAKYMDGSAQKTGGKPPRGKGTDYVYMALRDLIVRMELTPGEKIVEATLLETLGVSRTPLREALVRLAGDRLVTISPNHGAYVTPLDALGLTQYFEALELTHRALQHWACLRRTENDLVQITAACADYEAKATALNPVTMSESNLTFHHTVAGAANNDFLSEYELKLSILGLRIGWVWYRDFAEGDPAKDVARTIDEHGKILAAIKDRRVSDAESLAHSHIDAFRQRVFARLNRSLGSAISI